MRDGQSVYRLHADLAKRASSRQPGLLPGERLRGIGKPMPQKPKPVEPELGLNEQNMPVAY